MFLTARPALTLALGLLPVALVPRVETALVWVGLVVLAIVVDVWWSTAPSALTLTRDTSHTTGAPVRLGSPCTTEVIVANPRRRAVRLTARDAWQPSAGAVQTRQALVVPTGGSAVLRTTLLPSRRGDLTALGVTLRIRGPLGFAGRQRTTPVPGTIRVLPAFESRRHLPSRIARLRDLDGRAAVRVGGQGTEVDSLREYVRGDDVRSIDRRASARRRSVVVRTWQPERDRRVVLVLETGRLQAARVGEVPRLDASMDAALLLAALAGRAGDRGDFVAGDRRVRARLRTRGRSTAPLQDVMADLEPEFAEANWPTLTAAVHSLGRHRALVVLLTPLEPAAVREGLLPVLAVLARHHRVVIASVADPALAEMAAAPLSSNLVSDTYTAAAARQGVVERDRLVRVLASIGVDVVEADPEHLPPALADRYLAFKARGLL